MRAATYSETGASDVLRVHEIDDPRPGPGEVRVRVAVSGVNPTDFKSRSGATGGVGDAGFQVPGQDGAGTVDAVGEGVDPDRVGERVWLYLAAFGSPWGTGAELSVLPAERAVALGDASFDLGASLGVPALTAHRCLFADGPLGAGDSVLVAGGAGAVGHAAIELAARAGANVIATVSGPEKGALAERAGAQHVVTYTDEDAAEQVRAAAPDGVRRVVEVDLAANRDLDLAVIAGGGAIVTYADPGGALSFDSVRPLMTGNVVLRFMLLYGVPSDVLADAAQDVAAAVAEDALTTLPLHRFDLGSIAAAHDAVEGGAVGKVLVDVS